MKRIVIAVACLVALAAGPARAEEWKYELMLYGWLAGLDGTIGVIDRDVDADFDDLAAYLDFAMAGHFEAKSATTVLLTDVSYVGFEAERDATVLKQTVNIDLGLDQWIIEAGGGYRATPEFDLLLVGRYYILDMGATFESSASESSADGSEGWGDVYLGARYSKLLHEKWLLSLRGDIGMGGSEFAWFGNALVGYRFNEAFSTSVAWRVLSLDREDGQLGTDYFKWDITQDGLGVALGYSF